MYVELINVSAFTGKPECWFSVYGVDPSRLRYGCCFENVLQNHLQVSDHFLIVELVYKTYCSIPISAVQVVIHTLRRKNL